MLKTYSIYAMMFLLSFYLIGKYIVESQIPQLIVSTLVLLSIWGIIHTLIVVIIYSIIIIIEKCDKIIHYFKIKK